MKRLVSLFLMLALAVSLCACGQKADEPATWQEQYDLGMRYLSEGEYEQAILAFEAAIEIDPKQADAYIGLAEVYTVQGDTDRAREILEDAYAELGDERLREMTDELARTEQEKPEPEPAPPPVGDDLASAMERSLMQSLRASEPPAVLGAPADGLGAYYPIQLDPYTNGMENIGSSNGGLYYNGQLIRCDDLPIQFYDYRLDTGESFYTAGVHFSVTSAPENTEILDITVRLTDDAGPDTFFPLGWKDIMVGEDMETTLIKLGLAEDLAAQAAEYATVQINLHERGVSVRLEETSSARVGGEPVDQVEVNFLNSDNEYESTVRLIFDTAGRLAEGNFSNNLKYRDYVLSVVL